MKAKLKRSYKKLNKKGDLTSVFVYGVSGKQDEIDQFKEIQGDFFREHEDGTPLWFSTKFVGNDADLLITSNNKIVADMSKFDQADSLSKQYGGNLGSELAKLGAMQLMGMTPTEEVPSIPSVKREESNDVNLDDL